MTAMPLNV